MDHNRIDKRRIGAIMPSTNLSALGAWDSESGSLNVIIETPKGSRNKFDYNPKEGLFELGKVLPKGIVFPYDFGFVPSTQGNDGDPLDVLVLMDEPAFPGCKVCCRLIGVIEAEQTDKRHDTVRNDRLIGVVAKCQNDKGTRSLKQLPNNLVKEIEHFFVSYHALDGREFKALACRGPRKAARLVKEGMKRFHSTSGSKK
jgi:inorganic pyrophosphatase